MLMNLFLVKERLWKHWAKLPFIDYGDTSAAQPAETVTLNFLNIWHSNHWHSVFITENARKINIFRHFSVAFEGKMRYNY